jgi:2-hydroxychromene-2-carboxylate isomerase
MPHIDYYFSTVSSYSYLAGVRLEEVAARHDVRLTYKPIDILALYGRTGGRSVAERHPSRQEYRLQDLRRQAARLGMKMNIPPMFPSPNAAPSAYAIIAAQAKGGGDLGGLVHAFMRAVWAEERDISDDGLIRDLLAAHGFDPRLADSGLLLGAETYANNLEQAVNAGVFGAPFYVTDTGQRFWGQDRLEDLDAYLAGKL